MEMENTAYVPSLTLDSEAAPSAPEVSLQAVEAEKEAEKIDVSRLTPAEQQMVHDFAQKIDITNTGDVLNYGATSQKNIAAFSDTTLNAVRTKDMGEVGGMLTNLVVELKGMNFDEDEKKGFFGLRKKAANHMETLKAQYAKAETNVDTIVDALEKHQVVLLKDVATLDKLYELNQGYFKELTMYILAGKEKLAYCRDTVLPELQKKAQESGLPEDAQAANDYSNMINRFEKKIHDLELTRTISIQMAPQIRLLQNNDSLMVEKIQGSIVNTIPLWKSQMVLALGMHHSQQAMEAQREVTNVTNELLRKNADKLKMGSVEVAKESERGIVELETLKYTNEQLISTLEEVQSIQAEGRQKRAEAEVELAKIEGELKQKLLNLRK